MLSDRPQTGIRSWLKKQFRIARDRWTRASLRRRPASGDRVIMAPTWAFPNPTHAFVYQDMLGFLGRGFDVLVFMGERQAGRDVAARFRPLLDRTVCVETVRRIHTEDLAALDREHPGRVDAFLERVASAVGRSVSELRRDPLVLRACTFTRLAELAQARYLQSWFFYDQSFMAMFAAEVLAVPRGIACYTDHMLADFPFKLVGLHLATADLVFATSERTRRQLLQIGGAECAPRILVKPIGVDGEALRAVRAQRQRLGGDGFQLLSISRIEPKKGLLTLVEACAELMRRGRVFQVRLVGGEDSGHAASADYAGRVRDRIAEYGLSAVIELTGSMAHDAIAAALARASAFVAPYVETEDGDSDGMPTAVLEAMAAGLPVVCSRAGAIAEAVDDGVEGLVVPQHDAATLADAVERLMDDHELRARLGRGAASRFDREFDHRVTDETMHARVNEVLESRARGSAGK